MTHQELANQFRLAADSLERRNNVFSLWDAKHWLLAALNDVDRELNYGKPGEGLGRLIDTPINAEADHG